MIEGVGEALGYEEVELGVDIHLDAEHVGGGEGMVGGDAGFEEVVDALDAVGVGPVVGDVIGVVSRGDAGVGGGDDAGGGVEYGGERVVGYVAGPGLREVERVDGDGGDGRADGRPKAKDLGYLIVAGTGVGGCLRGEVRGGELVAGLVLLVLGLGLGGCGVEEEGLGGAGVLGGGTADGDAAEEVVPDVVGVGIDEVLGDAAEAGEGGDERGGVGGGVDSEEGRGLGGGIVDGPGESEGAMLGGVERGDDGGLDAGGADGVGGGEDVEGDVAAGADVDELGVMLDGGPGVVGAFVFGG